MLSRQSLLYLCVVVLFATLAGGVIYLRIMALETAILALSNSLHSRTSAKLTPPGTALPDTRGGSFCGGIAGVVCPMGYTCELEGNYPDAGGRCVKSQSK